MILRRATEKDVAILFRLIEKARKNGKILKRSHRELKASLEDFFVAEEDGHVIGCCALDIYSKKLAEVRSLAVAAERQRKGIASALLERCLKEARRKGIYEVLAITDRLNLFKKSGFYEQLHGQKALFLRP